jgi:hypothetical protein
MITKTAIGNYLRKQPNGDVGMYRNGFKDGVQWAQQRLAQPVAQPASLEHEPQNEPYVSLSSQQLAEGDLVPEGSFAHLKLMMEASAWDSKLELEDALANIDEFAAKYSKAQQPAEARPQKLILEHSGCGHGTQIEQITVRLHRGDKVVLIMGPHTAAIEGVK